MKRRLLTLYLAVPLIAAGMLGCSSSSSSLGPGSSGSNVTSGSGKVVVYSSVDEVFAEPICKRFQQNTGITVELVPDMEETKSTGLLNRLIAEKERPRADVFWSGDPVRAAILKSKGVSASYQSAAAERLPMEFSDSEYHWTSFSARARVLIYSKEPGEKLLAHHPAPASEIPLRRPGTRTDVSLVVDSCGHVGGRWCVGLLGRSTISSVSAEVDRRSQRATHGNDSRLPAQRTEVSRRTSRGTRI